MTPAEAVRSLAEALRPHPDPDHRERLGVLACDVLERLASELGGSPAGLLLEQAAEQAVRDFLSLAQISARAAAAILERETVGPEDYA